mmetsp:Transcript_80853/g.142617  ORF Transcript_80853/g.142617 Transcript_80853/m.142617 type:complete len:100 (-) Transcript_80853:1071-1370(-)
MIYAQDNFNKCKTASVPYSDRGQHASHLNQLLWQAGPGRQIVKTPGDLEVIAPTRDGKDDFTDGAALTHERIVNHRIVVALPFLEQNLRICPSQLVQHG